MERISKFMGKPSNKIKLTLSPQAEKYVRRDAPVEARRMAARGALPLEPIELATVLFALHHDPDQEVKERAKQSLDDLALDPHTYAKDLSPARVSIERGAAARGPALGIVRVEEVPEV